MFAKSSGWSRLGKLVLALLLLSVLLFVGCATHMIVTGVGVPYQDATPEQATYERFHNGIAMALMLGVMLSSLATFVVGTAWMIRWLNKKLRRKRVENIP